MFPDSAEGMRERSTSGELMTVPRVSAPWRSVGRRRRRWLGSRVVRVSRAVQLPALVGSAGLTDVRRLENGSVILTYAPD